MFETYVQRALQHQGKGKQYSPQETIHWLSWLASKLLQRGQTVFYIERMQPDWLPKGQRTLYPCFIAGLMYGLFAALIAGFVVAVTSDISGMNKLGMVVGVGFASGLLFGGLNGLLARRKTASTNTIGVTRKGGNILRATIAITLNGFLTASCIEGFIWIVSKPPSATYSIENSTLIIGNISGMLFFGGFIFALLNALIDGRMPEIQPVEHVSWSWKNMVWNVLKSLYIWVLGSLLVSVLYGIFLSIYKWSVIYGGEGPFSIYLPGALNQAANSALIFMILSGGLGGILGGLSGGLAGNTLDERNLLKPNQGIRRSALTSLCVALGSTLIVGLSVGLALILLSHGTAPLSIVVPISVLSGLACGLRYGGIACIQHVFLRWLLWRTKSMPWNYPRFLDDAARRILLRKVGGGYIFVHRLLLEYFATLESPLIPGEVVVQTLQFSQTGRGREQTSRRLCLEPTVRRSFSPFTSRVREGSYAQQHRFSRPKALLGLIALTVLIVAGGSSFWWFLLPHPLSTLPGLTYDYTIVWSPDGKHVTEIAVNGTMQVLNTKDGSHVALTRRRPHDQYHDVGGDTSWLPEWSPDDTRIAYLNPGGVVVQVWNMQAGGHVSTYQEPFSRSTPRSIRAIAWSPEENSLAILDTNGTVQIRDTEHEKHSSVYQISSLKVPPSDQSYYPGNVALAWSPDGKWLAAADNDSGTVQIWNAANGNLLSRFAYQARLASVDDIAWSPDGKHLALGYWEGTIQVRDATSGRSLLTYRGQTDIDDLAWSPNGKYIASAGGYDETLQVRDATNGILIHFYWLYPYSAQLVVWSPDGKDLALGDYDGTVQVWKAS